MMSHLLAGQCDNVTPAGKICLQYGSASWNGQILANAGCCCSPFQKTCISPPKDDKGGPGFRIQRQQRTIAAPPIYFFIWVEHPYSAISRRGRSGSGTVAPQPARQPARQRASRVTPTASLWPLKCLCLRRMGGAPTAPAVAPALPPGSRRALLFITYTLYILVNTVVTGTMPAMSAPSELGFSSAGCQPLRLHPALAATRPSSWLRPAI
eukprot:COSAG01_NODE_5812_length_4018_cov_5.428936_2_plen_210_part_00